MAQVTTSHYDIFNYWKTKRIDFLGNVVLERDDTEPVVGDWGEPCCWACERPVRGVCKDASYEKWCEGGDYQMIWNHKGTKHELNRCHIVPGAMGGKDEPSNLFLLCPECHVLSPDTNNPYNFLRWVFRRRMEMSAGKMKPNVLIERVDEELRTQGFPSSTGILKLMYEKGSVSDRENYLNGSMNPIDFIRPRMGLHCTAISDSTWVSVFVEWFRSMYLDAVLTN